MVSSRFNVERVKDVKVVDWDISRGCRREGNEQQRGGGEKTRNRGAGYVGLYIHIYSTSLGVEFTADRTPATTLLEVKGLQRYMAVEAGNCRENGVLFLYRIPIRLSSHMEQRTI